MKKEILAQLAEDFQTPLYIFHAGEFRERAELVNKSFGSRVGCCYSIKANPFLLACLPECFRNLEVCSPGELTICEKTGVDMKKVIYSGVNKGYADVLRAMEDGVGMFTAESRTQFELIRQCAKEKGIKVPVLLRLTAGSQFGMDESDILELVENRSRYSNIEIKGIHFFSGTQKKKALVIEKELKKLDCFCSRLYEEKNFSVEKLEYGTGLFVDYFGKNQEETEKKLLEEISPAVQELGRKYELTVEMGRFFAAPCGYYITRVADVKTNMGYHYAICDGGMHQLKYDGQTNGMQVPKITLINGNRNEEGLSEKPYTLCGSLCTTADVLATILLPSLEIGDLLVFHRTGAYSVTEGAAAFLSREMPAVVLYGEDEKAVKVRDYIKTDAFNTPA